MGFIRKFKWLKFTVVNNSNLGDYHSPVSENMLELLRREGVEYFEDYEVVYLEQDGRKGRVTGVEVSPLQKVDLSKYQHVKYFTYPEKRKATSPDEQRRLRERRDGKKLTNFEICVFDFLRDF